MLDIVRPFWVFQLPVSEIAGSIGEHRRDIQDVADGLPRHGKRFGDRLVMELELEQNKTSIANTSN
jgi:hypothetical protein